jgi:hypothetical protein
MASYIGRRKFLATLGGAAAAWPRAAAGGRIFQSRWKRKPFLLQFFRKALAESGYVMRARRSNCAAVCHWVSPNFMILAS